MSSPLKVSDMILKGSVGMTQTRFEMFKMVEGVPIGCCAVGAALIGQFGLEAYNRWQASKRTYDLFSSIDGDFRCCKLEFCDLLTLMMHLNDKHKESFTAIADKLKVMGS